MVLTISGNIYLDTFILFVGLFLSLSIVFFIFERILLKIVIKTKTDLDDIILKKSYFPFSILLMLVSLRITLAKIDFGFSSGISSFVNNMVYTALMAVVGYLVYIVVDLFIVRAFNRFAHRTKSYVDKSIFSLVHSVLRVALIVIFILYTLSIWGVEIVPLLGALGIAGLAVALALQPVLGNVFSGASIVLDKSIRVGDLVYLDQQTKGKIVKVGMRSTRILTFDNELIIVPNSKLADSIIQNVAQPEPKSRVVVPFSVAYGSDAEKVKKIVMDEINTVNNLINDPEPLVRFLEMGESSLNFKAYFYVDSYENRFKAIDEIVTKIYNALRKANIEIPFPQMDVHLKK